MCIKRFKKHPIFSSFRDTFYMGAGSIIGAFISYLLLFILGRKLTIEDFGIYNALSSLSCIIGVPTSVLAVSISKGAAEFSSKKDPDKLTNFFKVLTYFSLNFGVVVFLAVFALRFIIAANFKIQDSFVIVIFGLMAGTGFLSSIPSPYLQGLLRFRSVSLFTVLSGVLRLLLPVFFVYMGFRLYGVFVGMILSGILSYLIGFNLLKRNFVTNTDEVRLQDYKKLLLFSIPTLLVTLCLTIAGNIDVILVKKYFDPLDAGYYAGTVTMGKILLFGSSIITSVMFPVISSIYAKGKSYKAKIRQFAVLQTLVVLTGLTVFMVIPGILTHAFFGKQFGNSIAYLPLFAVFVTMFVLVNFIVMYSLAIEKVKVFIYLIPGVLMQVIGIILFHANIFEVIYVNIASSALTLALLAASLLLL